MADESDIEVKFGASIEALQEGSEKAAEQIKEFADQAKEAADSAKEHFTELAELFGVAFTADAFKEWIASSAELGEQLERTAAKLGITGEQASGLMGVAKLTGTSFEGLQTAMERLQVGLATVDQKSSRTGEALRVLGIDAKEMASSSITQQINILSEAISKFQDGATKTAAVQALGRSFVELLPLLDRGKEGLDELNATLDATGSKMSNEMVESFAHTAEDINVMKGAWQGLSNTIYSAVNPAIDAAVKEMTSLIEHADPSAIQTRVAGLTSSLVTMAAEIAKFAVEARIEWEKLEAVIGAIGGSIASAGDKIAGVLNGIVSATKSSPEYTYEMQTGYANLFAKLGIISQEYANQWKKDQADIYTTAKSTFGGIDEAATRTNIMLQAIDASAKAVKDSLAKIGMPTSARSDAAMGGEAYNGPAETKPSVPQMQLGGGGGKKDDPAKDAEEDAAHWIKLWTDAAGKQEAALDGALKRHQISTAQWLTGTEDALQDELQDTLATYQKELETANLTAQQRKAIHDKMTEAIAANELKIGKAQEKAADESEKSWDSAMKTLNSAPSRHRSIACLPVRKPSAKRSRKY